MVDQDTWIQVVETTSGLISLISCIAMAKKVYQERTSSLAGNMLAFLFVIDFVLALFYSIGRSAISNYGICQFQAVMIQWFSLCAFGWVAIMSYIMYKWIVQRKHPKRLMKGLKKSQTAALILSGVFAFVLLGVGVYGDAGIWCWIGDDHPQVRLWCFEIFLMAAWGINLFMIQQVFVSIQSRMHHSTVQMRIGNLLSSTTTIQRKLILYAAAFGFLWFFPLLNRLVEYGYGDRVFITSLLTAIFLPLQGFVNALLYGDFLDIRRLLKVADIGIVFFTNHLPIPGLKHSTSSEQLQEVIIDATPENMDLVAKTQTTYIPKKYSIFTTTLNLGEASLQSLLTEVKDWIVEGHDVYAIGLQECMDLNGIRELILSHLGGEQKYCMYTSSIGSDNTRLGYHGFIALTVFVKKSEIDCGYIHATTPTSETMATGTDLIITTAQNKGAVGVPLQIHDTSIGFVTCHLPSDSKGKSKLTKRNASAHAILKEVILAPEDLGFDLHLQHDHIMVFGDLNYRMETQGEGAGVNSLTGVSVACCLEKETLQQDPFWLQRKYNLLRHASDPLHPGIEDVRLLHQAKVCSRGAWASVLRADELRSIMEDGDAFYGFEEPMPCFPPSYKRKKGKKEGDCGDYSDFTKIISGYSNLGYIENELLFPANGNGGPTEPHEKKTTATKAKKLQKKITKHLGISVHKEDIAFMPDAEDLANAKVLNKARSNSNGSSTGIPHGGSSMHFNTSHPLTKDDDSKDEELSIVEEEDGGVGEDGDESVGGMSQGGGAGNEEGIEDGSRPSMDIRPSESLSDPNSPQGKNNRRGAVLAKGPTKNFDSKKITDPSKLRPPSFTDRILVHSLPDRKERVTVQAYDFCDTLRVSDHRAVSMTILLEVNAAIEYFGEGESTAAHGKRKAAIEAMGHTIPAAGMDKPRDNRISMNISKLVGGGLGVGGHNNSSSALNELSTTVYPKEPKFELYELIITELTTTVLDIHVDEDTEGTDGGDGNDPELSYDSIYGSNRRRSTTPQMNTNTMSQSRASSLRIGEGNHTSHQQQHSEGDKEVELQPVSSFSNSSSTSPTISKDSEASLSQRSRVNSTATTVPTNSIGRNKSRKSSFWDRRFSSLDAETKQTTTTTKAARKSSRKQSIFSYFYREDPSESESDVEGGGKGTGHRGTASGTGASGTIEEENEEDIFKEMARESLAAWEDTGASGNTNAWRKKVLEEERQRSLQQYESQHIPTQQLKSAVKKKKKSNDKRISNITVVFPLPAKDPLLIHRRMFDYATIFEFVDEQISPLAPVNTAGSSSSSPKELSPSTNTVSTTASGIRSHPDVEKGSETSPTKPDFTSGGAGKTGISPQELLRPMSVFSWTPKPTTSTENAVSLRIETTFQDDGMTSFEVKGCASPELGAHALIKITNKLGYEFGSSVICVTHLIHRDPHILRTSYMTNIPLSAGAQKRGTISGKFSLRYIPSPLSIDQ